MKSLLSLLFGLAAGLCLTVFLAWSPRQVAPTVDEAAAVDSVTSAARAFVETLDEEARSIGLFAFEDAERFNWHFIPRERNGLPLKDMTLEQRKATHDLLNSALSVSGYLKVAGILHVEQILKIMEDDSLRRDPEGYYLSVFGDPSSDEPWGWRFEGHHLSLNFSSATNELSTTPAFFGSNPAEVRVGPYAGLRVLGTEEDLGRALVLSLDDDQRARALIATEAPNDIIMTPDRETAPERFEGLPAADMTDAQRELLWDIVETYAHNMEHDLAHDQLEDIRAAGIETLYFAWAGSLERGEPHYYRIHGPTAIFEYDNTQNDANHIHTVWRDHDDDFGADLLRLHYEKSGDGHGH